MTEFSIYDCSPGVLGITKAPLEVSLHTSTAPAQYRAPSNTSYDTVPRRTRWTKSESKQYSGPSNTSYDMVPRRTRCTKSESKQYSGRSNTSYDMVLRRTRWTKSESRLKVKIRNPQPSDHTIQGVTTRGTCRKP
jgi:hypothetical protein